MVYNYSSMTVTMGVTNVTVDTSTATDVCSDEYPVFSEYIAEILGHPVELVFAILSMLVCTITVVLYVTEVFSEHYKYKDAGKRLAVLILLGIYPMTSINACFAVIVPKTTILSDLLASCYLSVCLFTFIRIMIQYYGNTDSMITILKSKKITLRVPPCCCCCCFLPMLDVNSRTVKVVKLLIMQAAVVQPCVYFMQAVVWANDVKSARDAGLSSPFTYLNLMIIISIVTAIYGLVVFVRASQIHLKKHKIQLKLLMLQSVLIFSNLQHAIFESVLVKFGVPGCAGTWGTRVRASLIEHMLLVFEMFVMAILARLVYRKSDHRNISSNQLYGTSTSISASTTNETNGQCGDVAEDGTTSFKEYSLDVGEHVTFK